jgi:hypothetical protein
MVELGRHIITGESTGSVPDVSELTIRDVTRG